jgi:hypothetical protein
MTTTAAYRRALDRTPTATAPGSLRTAVSRLAADLARDANNATGYTEAKYRAIAPARDALAAAEGAHREAERDAEAIRALPSQLARALGWPLGIVAEEPNTRRDGPSTSYLAAFGGGRVTSAPMNYHGTPKGHAHGWILRPDGSRGRDPGETYDYGPVAGTNDPDKLRAQVDDATANLLAWLAGHTADAWLRAHGIDPRARPPLVSLVSLAIDAISPNGYYRPVWILALAGYEIARTDDRRDLLTPEEERAHGYAGVETILGDLPDGEEAAREYAQRHAERARAALLRRFTYQPEPR